MDDVTVVQRSAGVGPQAAEGPRVAGLPIAGGVLAGIVGSLCCVGPLALVLVGVGGSRVANLTALQPWSPVFVGVAALAFGFAAWKLFLAPKVCAPGTPCADPRTLRNQRVVFAIAAPIVTALLSFPLYAHWFY